jgi:hypothetical protein
LPCLDVEEICHGSVEGRLDSGDVGVVKFKWETRRDTRFHVFSVIIAVSLALAMYIID